MQLVVLVFGQPLLVFTFPDSIALVTPITSKGKIAKSEALPLFSVSLPSLCGTASAGYRYTYFLCYTQGDVVFGNASIVQRHFDQVSLGTKK
jgi:hypothetical protein